MRLLESTLLNKRFTVKNILGNVGPLDITYKAWDQQANKQVVVRELFPQSLVARANDQLMLNIYSRDAFNTGLSQFQDESQKIINQDPDGFAGFFYENRTIYRFRDFIEGHSLNTFAEPRTFTEEEAISLLQPLLKTLIKAHKAELYHLNLSPDTVLISPEGQPVLPDFYMSRFELANVTGNSKDIKPRGFAPPGPLPRASFPLDFHDVYGVASLLFFLITKKIIWSGSNQSHNDRVQAALDSSEGVSDKLRNLLRQALMIESKPFYLTMTVFRELLVQISRKPESPHSKQDYFSILDRSKNQSSTIERFSALRWEATNLSSAERDQETDVLAEDTLLEEPVPGDPKPIQASGTPAGIETTVREPQTTHVNPAIAPDRPVSPPATHVKKPTRRTPYLLVGLLILIAGLTGGFFAASNFFTTDSSSAQHALQALETDGPDPSSREMAGTPATLPEQTRSTPPKPDQSVSAGEEPQTKSVHNVGTPIDSDPVTEDPQRAEAPSPPALSRRETAPASQVKPQTEPQTPATLQKSQAIPPPPTQTVFSPDQARADEPENTLHNIVPLEADLEHVRGLFKKNLSREKSYHYYRSEGDALLKQGFSEQARASYYKALEYRPNDPYVVERIMTSN